MSVPFFRGRAGGGLHRVRELLRQPPRQCSKVPHRIGADARSGATGLMIRLARAQIRQTGFDLVPVVLDREAQVHLLRDGLFRPERSPVAIDSLKADEDFVRTDETGEVDAGLRRRPCAERARVRRCRGRPGAGPVLRAGNGRTWAAICLWRRRVGPMCMQSANQRCTSTGCLETPGARVPLRASRACPSRGLLLAVGVLRRPAPVARGGRAVCRGPADRAAAQERLYVVLRRMQQCVVAHEARVGSGRESWQGRYASGRRAAAVASCAGGICGAAVAQCAGHLHVCGGIHIEDGELRARVAAAGGVRLLLAGLRRAAGARNDRGLGGQLVGGVRRVPVGLCGGRCLPGPACQACDGPWVRRCRRRRGMCGVRPVGSPQGTRGGRRPSISRSC